MDESNSHETLSELEGRVESLRKKHQPDAATEEDNSAGVALRIGIDLIAGVAFGVGTGYLLDRWLDTSPWLLLLFFFLGTAAGIRNVFRTAMSIEQKEVSRTNNQSS